MTREEIGAILKEIRLESGKTQKEVAELLGRKQQIIGHWETGYSQPDANTLFLLCDIYGTTVDKAFGFKRKDLEISKKDMDMIEKYHSLDSTAQSHVDSVLDWEVERSGQLRQSQSQIDSLRLQLSQKRAISRFFAYYGRVAAAGTSVEFSGMAAGTKSFPESELNKNADYVIGVSGDSMEPEYYNGDIVYVQKTDHIETGDIGIFQKGSSIYIKKAGENGLISINPNYPPLTGDGDRIAVLGKVLGKAEEN